MNITDKEALKELRLIRSEDLYESVKYYPEDERDDRTDMEFIADEISYWLSCFKESGHCYHDELEWARDLLKETKNGKVIPLWKESLTPIYSKDDIRRARYLINEYKRFVNSMNRLNKKGYYGKW